MPNDIYKDKKKQDTLNIIVEEKGYEVGGTLQPVPVSPTYDTKSGMSPAAEAAERDYERRMAEKKKKKQ